MVLKWLKNQYDDLKGHIKFAILALVWAPMFEGLKHLLREGLKLPNWAAWLIVLFASFVAFMAALRSLRTNTRPQQSLQIASATLTHSNSKFDATYHFQHAYTSPLTEDAEKNILIAAEQILPEDHEGFLAKFIGIGLVAYWGCPLG